MLQRRHLLIAAAAAPAAVAAPPGAPLPAVNLRLQWRWTTVERRSEQAGAVQGNVRIGTGGVVDARGQASLRARQRERADEPVQQVLLLNGGRASVRLAQTRPLAWIEFVWTPRGPGALLRQVPVEQVTGLSVLARWPGAGAPVEVELLAQAAGPGAGELATQLRLEPGEWLTVARAGAERIERDTGEPGSLSTRQAERTVEQALQLRVLTP